MPSRGQTRSHSTPEREAPSGYSINYLWQLACTTALIEFWQSLLFPLVVCKFLVMAMSAKKFWPAKLMNKMANKIVPSNLLQDHSYHIHSFRCTCPN